MEKNDIKPLIGSIITTAIGAGLAYAGGYGGVKLVGQLSVFAFEIILAFSIQWIMFIHAWIKKTELYYDLTGSITYMTVIVTSILLSPNVDFRSILLMVLVLIWAGRLGTFLYKRIKNAGKDRRFDEIKESALRFFQTWTIQGLWVSFTVAAALGAITSGKRISFGAWGVIGLVIWIVGFLFESIADYQKKKFTSDPENQGKFINVGLWSISRHPNYFGEITMWIGIAIIAVPTMESWRFFTLISPVFVAFLITQISGLPKLESYAEDKWGGQEDYEKYKKNTPILIPKLACPEN